jgi:hypothetical protein
VERFLEDAVVAGSIPSCLYRLTDCIAEDGIVRECSYPHCGAVDAGRGFCVANWEFRSKTRRNHVCEWFCYEIRTGSLAVATFVLVSLRWREFGVLRAILSIKSSRFRSALPFANLG